MNLNVAIQQVQSYLYAMQQRGLAGNITPTNIADPEVRAAWAGKKSRLVIRGGFQDFRIALEDDHSGNGDFVEIWVEDEPEKFHCVITDFCVREG